MSETSSKLPRTGDNLPAPSAYSENVRDYVVLQADPKKRMRTNAHVTGLQRARAAVVGVQTVTATPAEAFAGASTLQGRRGLRVTNEGIDPHTSEAAPYRVLYGGSDLSRQNGHPIEPGQSTEFQFDEDTPVPVYLVSETGTPIPVRVEEF